MIKACANTLKAGAVALALMLVLVGCVTKTAGPEVDHEQALDTHIQLTLAYIENRNRDSARHHLRRAQDLDSRSARVMAAEAMLFQLEGEYDRAEQSFQRALRRDRQLTSARNNYAAFLYERERYDEAYEQFEIVSQDLDYGNRPRALMNLGRSALQLGNERRAMSAFEQAHRLDPELSGVLLELAELYYNNEQYADAKRYLDRYAEVTRHSARSLLLGIRIERLFGNKDQESSYVLSLRNRFPYSDEYLEYQRELNN